MHYKNTIVLSMSLLLLMTINTQTINQQQGDTMHSQLEQVKQEQCKINEELRKKLEELKKQLKQINNKRDSGINLRDKKNKIK